jgi:hypothetical protein
MVIFNSYVSHNQRVPRAVCRVAFALRARWLCPATWRSTAPDVDGGHSALLAVERPSGDVAESVGCGEIFIPI